MFGRAQYLGDFCNYICISSKKDIFLPISAEKLPLEMRYGPRMTTTTSGDGLLMTYNKGIYSFKCTSENSCSWTTEQQELKISRTRHVMLTVPSALMKNC